MNGTLHLHDPSQKATHIKTNDTPRIKDQRITQFCIGYRKKCIDMPSFETLVLSAPAGFMKACMIINELVESHEDDFCKMVSYFL